MDVGQWLRHNWATAGLQVRCLGVFGIPPRRRALGPRGRERVDYHLVLQVEGRATYLHPLGSWTLDPGGMLLFPAVGGTACRGHAVGARHLVCDALVGGPAGADPLALLELPARADPERLPQCADLLKRWRRAFDPVGADQGTVLQARRDAQLLFDVFLLAWQATATATAVYQQALPLGLRQAIRFMRLRFPSRSLRVADIAREAGLAESTLSRHFATHLQTTPWAYLTGLRLEAARRLGLAEPHVAWTTIAERCGFGDYRHFARLFARRFAELPSEARSSDR